MSDALRGRLRLVAALGDAGGAVVGALLVLRVLGALLPAALALTLSWLVQRVSEAPAAGVLTAAGWPLAAFGAVLLAGHGADFASAPLEYLAANRVNGAHRARMVRLLSATPSIAPLERADVQELVRVSRADAQSWTERTPGDGAVDQLKVVAVVLGVAGAAAVLARHHWLLAVALSAAALLSTYLRSRHQLVFSDLWAAHARSGLHAHVWQEAIVAPGEGKDLRVFGLGEWVVRRVRGHLGAMFEPIWRAQTRYARAQWVQFVIVAGPLLVAYVTVARTAVGGGTDAGTLTAVLAAGWGVYEAARYIDPRNTHGGIAGLAAFERLQRIVAETPAGRAAPSAPATTAGPPDVRFTGVRFAYPGAGGDVISGLDLHIRPGELLAVVGLNGAGKSTLIKLLAGLYRPSAGRITVDGTDLSDLDPAHWRRRLAVVFQDFVHYPFSLADNVLLGQPTAPRDDVVLRGAVRDAGLTALLERLPQGCDTPLSPTRTGGVDLSGGQWQQVGLARALYAVRGSGQLLVLDEPTAHLDVRTERELFARLGAHRGAASVVLISHRLTTVRQADRIVLLDRGRIAESGTHDELMAAGGGYATLFTTQARRES